MVLKTLRLYLTHIDVRRHTGTQCGHGTFRKGWFTRYGKLTFMKMPLNKEGSVDWCMECIANMTIRCAWCGNAIVIGSPVTLYMPSEKFPARADATPYYDDPRFFVGCSRAQCSDYPFDRRGFWVPNENGNGMVEIVLTPEELALRGNGVVVIENVGDINEARRLSRT